MNRVHILKNNIPKLYGILWVLCNTGLQNEVQGDTYCDTNSDSFVFLWLMDKLKLNSSGIVHTSNPFRAAFHTLKGVFNLQQYHTGSMYSFYKNFDSVLVTCKLIGCDATSLLGLEKHTDYSQDSRQRMSTICLIEIDDSQRFSQLFNWLDNGTILRESTYIYPKNISEAYDIIYKYKISTNTMLIPLNRLDVSFYQRVAGNQTCPPIDGTNEFLHRDDM